MKMKIISYFVSLLLVSITALGNDFPEGTFTLKMDESQFLLTLKSDSSYVIELIDQFKVQGIYKISNDTLIINDNSGERSCPTPGKYLWHYENKELKFTVLSDECTGRADILVAGPWSLKE